MGRSQNIMIGILIVTHGKLAEGFTDSVSMIMGEQGQLKTIGLFADSDLEQFKNEVYEGMLQVDKGDGILVFADMFGASPCNFAAANVERLTEQSIPVRIITGLNLSMLIECLSMRSFMNDLNELYKNILETGKDSIKELLDTINTQSEASERIECKEK